jgi:dihydroceramidase
VRRFVIQFLENSILESDKAQDYYATVYSAEIVNTLTNLLFVWLAFRGINNCRKNGHDRIFLITFIGYLIVGTGSFLFHTTLKCQY